MTESFEYCIVGAGVVGSAAAFLLARAGHSVVAIEQFELAHSRGSSHGESRIIRYSYDHPLYVQMSKRAYPFWDELSKESSEQLMLTTGGIDLDEFHGERILPCISSMKSEGIEHEVLDAKEISRRFPQFRLSPHIQGLFQKDTGILNAGLCVRTLQALAQKHGAVFHANTKVNRIEHERKQIRISAGEREFKARKLMLCAGGWMGPLLNGFGIKLDLQVSQEQYAFFKPLDPDAFKPGRFPVFIHYNGAGSGGIGWYGLPLFSREGLKSSVHKTGKIVNASSRDFVIDQAVMALLKDLMQTVLPDAAGEIIHTETCLYTNSADTNFVLDYLPGYSNTVFFTGCSGHAFKFGPVLAEMMISMLNQESSSEVPDLFSIKRYLPYSTGKYLKV